MPPAEDARSVPRADARSSLKKAQELVAAAESALSEGRWNAAGLDAIHAGICGADAALIAVAGVRSASKDHGVAVQLLAARVRDFTAAQRRHLTGLLKEKNAVAYEGRLLTEVEARQLVDHGRRLVRWSTELVGRQLP
jgi:hypothetical protein